MNKNVKQGHDTFVVGVNKRVGFENLIGIRRYASLPSSDSKIKKPDSESDDDQGKWIESDSKT